MASDEQTDKSLPMKGSGWQRAFQVWKYIWPQHLYGAGLIGCVAYTIYLSASRALLGWQVGVVCAAQDHSVDIVVLNARVVIGLLHTRATNR